MPDVTLPYRTGRALVIGDLHHDFWAAEGRDPFDALPDGFFDALDVVLVAGDLTNKPKVRWPAALDWLDARIPAGRLCLFPGNHDYYDFRLDGDDRLAEIAAEGGAGFVQTGTVMLGSTRFLCATLWTDFALGGDMAANVAAAKARLSDFRKIRVAGGGYRKLRAADLLRCHRAQLARLKAALAAPWPGETVVVTHHAPVAGAASQDPLAASFASDLSALISRTKPAAWLFAHTHKPFEAWIGPTRVANVSLGYPDEFADDTVAARRVSGLIVSAQAPD